MEFWLWWPMSYVILWVFHPFPALTFLQAFPQLKQKENKSCRIDTFHSVLQNICIESLVPHLYRHRGLHNKQNRLESLPLLNFLPVRAMQKRRRNGLLFTLREDWGKDGDRNLVWKVWLMTGMKTAGEWTMWVPEGRIFWSEGRAHNLVLRRTAAGKSEEDPRGL